MAETRQYFTEDQYKATIFGRDYRIHYSVGSIAFAVFMMRIAIGWIFLQAGLTKITESDWSATGYLTTGIHPDNPFIGFFESLANSGLVDFLNMWGVAAIGVFLLVGLFVRWSAFWGAVVMALYWMSALQGNLGDFLPVEHGYVVDQHIVYIFLLFGLGTLGAGHIIGLDAWASRTDFARNNRWTKYFLG